MNFYSIRIAACALIFLLSPALLAMSAPKTFSKAEMAIAACEEMVDAAFQKREQLAKFKKYAAHDKERRLQLKENKDLYLRAFDVNYLALQAFAMKGKQTLLESEDQEKLSTYSHNCALLASGLLHFVEYMLTGHINGSFSVNYELAFRTWLSDANSQQ